MKPERIDCILRETKELPRVNRTYDPVFNLRFLENIGGSSV